MQLPILCAMKACQAVEHSMQMSDSVACARLMVGHCSLELVQLRGRERDRHRAHVLLQVLDALGARDRDDVLAPRLVKEELCKKMGQFRLTSSIKQCTQELKSPTCISDNPLLRLHVGFKEQRKDIG